MVPHIDAFLLPQHRGTMDSSEGIVSKIHVPRLQKPLSASLSAEVQTPYGCLPITRALLLLMARAVQCSTSEAQACTAPWAKAIMLRPYAQVHHLSHGAIRLQKVGLEVCVK
jgi:hypothetical protein